MNIKKLYCELEIEAEVDYIPPRSAPFCQDRNSPRFSDMGDQEEIEITNINFVIIDDNGNRKLIKIPDDLTKYICDSVSEQILEECRFQYELYKSDKEFQRFIERMEYLEER